ncbi:MAG: carboxylating nicotinate-nucleotide diphosphorylase [Solirubrobacterales bacterium]
MSELPPGTSELITRALNEDLGPGDVTAEATVAAGAMASARIVLKQPGVIFGLGVVEQVFRQAGVSEFEGVALEGHWYEETPVDVALIHGPARALLAGERVALNFLGHLSGISTLTSRFVQAVAGTGARILDTRKTTPGLRLLEKQAVLQGGGLNHRIGLYDAVLIKENHIAMAGGLGRAVEACRQARPGLMIEVEAESVTQVEEALAAGADRILLDNMTPEQTAAAVVIRNGAGRVGLGSAGADKESVSAAGSGSAGMRPELESSGGIDLSNVREIAEMGVDFISVGGLTHSAPVLDFSLLLKPV